MPLALARFGPIALRELVAFARDGARRLVLGRSGNACTGFLLDLTLVDRTLRHRGGQRLAGLGHEEIAAVLGETVYAVRQKWTYARAWLRAALTELA